MKSLFTALLAAFVLALANTVPAVADQRCPSASAFDPGKTLIFAEDEDEKKKKKDGEEEEPDCE